MPPANSGNDNSNPQAGQGRPLPKKENDIFKNVVKFYEQKQYKKAVKQADLILKKFPNHGETLAMKGLVLNNMGKKDEAVALVKQGLMNDMRCVLVFVFVCTARSCRRAFLLVSIGFFSFFLVSCLTFLFVSSFGSFLRRLRLRLFQNLIHFLDNFSLTFGRSKLFDWKSNR